MKLLALLPQDKTFNDTLWNLAQIASKTCQDLHALLASPSGAAANELASAIMADKDRAKALYEQNTVALCNSFVTPYDREDLRELAGTLYNIPRQVNHAKHRWLAYGSEDHRADFLIFTDLLNQQAKALETMITEFNKHRMQAVYVASHEIHELEDKADDLLTKHLAELAHHTADTKQFILLKDIFDLLGRTADAFRSASDLALRIILKHT